MGSGMQTQLFIHSWPELKKTDLMLLHGLLDAPVHNLMLLWYCAYAEVNCSRGTKQKWTS